MWLFKWITHENVLSITFFNWSSLFDSNWKMTTTKNVRGAATKPRSLIIFSPSINPNSEHFKLKIEFKKIETLIWSVVSCVNNNWSDSIEIARWGRNDFDSRERIRTYNFRRRFPESQAFFKRKSSFETEKRMVKDISK